MASVFKATYKDKRYSLHHVIRVHPVDQKRIIAMKILSIRCPLIPTTGATSSISEYLVNSAATRLAHILIYALISLGHLIKKLP